MHHLIRWLHGIFFHIPKDRRSRRIVVVIECVLNQNARDDGAAVTPAINRAVIDLCQEYEVGILQIPCPEMDVLGFKRNRPPGISIRAALDSVRGRRRCREISIGIANRLQDYSRQGYKILAIIGGNPESPGCAVHPGEHGLTDHSGVLMRELYDELRKRNLMVPFKGVRDSDLGLMESDIRWLKELFSKMS